MTTLYEWDIEETDENGDVVDHNHSEDLQSLKYLFGTGDLVLVRDEVGGVLVSRSWAYVKNGALPNSFMDAAGNPVAKVPARFHRELALAIRP